MLYMLVSELVPLFLLLLLAPYLEHTRNDVNLPDNCKH